MKIKIFSLLLLVGFLGFLLFANQQSSTLNAKTTIAPTDPVNWDKMDRSDRMALMKKVVFPTMRKEFQAFDAKRYANFKCITCHGAGVSDGSYKMPNPELPKLPSSKEGWEKIMKEKGDMLKFMKEHVKPEMASMLGMKPYDMKTKTGFGCGNCHTDEKE
jgi:hypothetical protein